MKLVISECMVKALAFDTRQSEFIVYSALMAKVNELRPTKQTVPKIRRQFRLNGSMISIVIQYRQDSITIIPAANKKTMSLDHSTFLNEIKGAYGTEEEQTQYFKTRLLTI